VCRTAVLQGRQTVRSAACQRARSRPRQAPRLGERDAELRRLSCGRAPGAERREDFMKLGRVTRLMVLALALLVAPLAAEAQEAGMVPKVAIQA
jgi:hypothetical protein